MKLLKTDEEFFQLVLKSIKLAPDECCMVGDSIESDIEAAQKAQILALLLDRRNSRQFTPKIQNLREINKFVKP
jgi:FMN phosphatase YigB (HAD superfamily)